MDIYPAASGASALTTCDYVVVFATELEPEAEELKEHLRELLRSWYEYRRSVVPSNCDWRWNERMAQAPTQLRSPREQLDEVAMAFSLSMTQTAAVFDVSRQTVYDWRKGASIRPESRARLGDLHELAAYYREMEAAPVGEALTWTDTSTGKSLLDLLQTQPLDRDAILSCLNALPKRIKEHFAPADALIAQNADDGWPEVPERWRKQTRRYSSGRAIRSRERNP
ncbi:MAG: hypothetical protein ACREIA_22250 [Opitutaceae bacterium]